MSLITDEIENLSRYQSFIVFEPASVRVSDSDIFLIGQDVRTFFDKTIDVVQQNESDIKMKIMLHQMQKLSKMLDLIDDYGNIIITKFFDRIWRRYSYITHLGESFIDLNHFLNFFPEYNNKMDKVIAQRVDIDIDEFDENTEDEDSSDDETDPKLVEAKENKLGVDE